MTASAPLRNIIFDLGGVIIDLDIPLTKKALAELGIREDLLDYSPALSNNLFLRYETGMISTEDFRNEMRDLSGVSFSNEDFDRAWCAMLVKLPVERVRLLLELRKSYRVFLLSNTSEIHALHFETMFTESAGVAMQDCFEKRYYSFECGLAKPTPEIFQYIVDEKGILPGETLFIDDTEPNAKAAEALGFRTVHLKPGMQITELAILKN